jgi:hypothetical protein
MKIIYLITLMAILTSACTKTAKIIEEHTDIWSFTMHHLDMSL